MDDAAARPIEAAEPAEVEVERVDETGGRLTGDPVHLDLEPTPLELAPKGEQELIAASVRRRRELVEEREVGPAGSVPDAIELGGDDRAQRPPGSAGSKAGAPQRPAKLHAVTPGRAAATSSAEIDSVYRDHVRWRSTVSRARRPSEAACVVVRREPR